MYPPTFQNNDYRLWPAYFKSRGQFQRPNNFINRFNRPAVFNTQITHDEYWCETCDKSFRTQNLLENHKQQHQTCNIDGCQFVAHPKVITKHIQMQHSSGLYKKISALKNPEEIQKWREERKRKYPTKQNIEKKAAEIQEKIERGEKMGLKYVGKDKSIKSDTTTRRTYKFDKRYQKTCKRTNETNYKLPPPKRMCNVVPEMIEKRKLKPFTGIQQLISDDDDENDKKNDKNENLQFEYTIEDDDYTEEVTSNITCDTVQAEPTVCGALSSLICNYGSSDEEILPNITHSSTKLLGKQPIVVVNKNCISESKELNKTPNEKLVTNNNHDKSDNDSGPEEVEIIKPVIDKTETSIESNYTRPSSKPIISNVKRNTLNINHKLKPRIPSTLLEKLLRREIEKERNIVLQCVRYVVKNIFLK